MQKNVLFLVTGMTPQIITETVWALACNPDNEEHWIPDEIHVLSTEDGLIQIKSRLFSEGIFKKFQQDYSQLKNITFGHEQLHLIHDANNNALSDLKTPEDNEGAANAICEKIAEFTQDDQVVLHVSIAGGRKTMGFYAGYALSLYGRAQDSMSHVLVEDKFESARNFFYPTPESNFVTDRFGKEWDTKDASIWLAKIPFVRLKDAVKTKHHVKSDKFSEVVHKINESFNDVTLVINLDDKSIVVNDKFTITDLSPREFAVLHWFADNRQKDKAGIVAPRLDANSKSAKQEDADYLQDITQQFIAYYDDVRNISSDFIVDKKFFESVRSNLKKALEGHLGFELASKIAIKQDKKGLPFYLDLPVDAIKIVDSFQN